MVVIPPDRFEQLVADALDSLPAELGRMMDNVAVFIEDQSPGNRLLGLYEGVPLTHREQYTGAFPDRITIFRETICELCASEDEAVAEVRRTVVHEIGHHFGLSDRRLGELGW